MNPLIELGYQRASLLAIQRAEQSPAKGSLMSKVAAQMPEHLSADVRAGMEFALLATTAIRTAPDYDPAVHGQTDNEIAAFILSRVPR
jgi:hypothetical protein